MYRELRALGAPQGVARRVPFDNNLTERDIRMPKRNNVYVALQVLQDRVPRSLFFEI